MATQVDSSNFQSSSQEDGISSERKIEKTDDTKFDSTDKKIFSVPSNSKIKNDQKEIDSHNKLFLALYGRLPIHHKGDFTYYGDVSVFSGKTLYSNVFWKPNRWICTGHEIKNSNYLVLGVVDNDKGPLIVCYDILNQVVVELIDKPEYSCSITRVKSKVRQLGADAFIKWKKKLEKEHRERIDKETRESTDSNKNDEGSIDDEVVQDPPKKKKQEDQEKRTEPDK